jgi:hypothetical protein
MKPRQAAALALVGWYLMAPPLHSVVGNDQEQWDESAPLSKWKLIDSYDSAEQCGRVRFLLQNEKQYSTQHDAPTAAQRAYVRSFVCVATDDPRLKPN